MMILIKGLIGNNSKALYQISLFKKLLFIKWLHLFT